LSINIINNSNNISNSQYDNELDNYEQNELISESSWYDDYFNHVMEITELRPQLIFENDWKFAFSLNRFLYEISFSSDTDELEIKSVHLERFYEWYAKITHEVKQSAISNVVHFSVTSDILFQLIRAYCKSELPNCYKFTFPEKFNSKTESDIIELKYVLQFMPENRVPIFLSAKPVREIDRLGMINKKLQYDSFTVLNKSMIQMTTEIETKQSDRQKAIEELYDMVNNLTNELRTKDNLIKGLQDQITDINHIIGSLITEEDLDEINHSIEVLIDQIDVKCATKKDTADTFSVIREVFDQKLNDIPNVYASKAEVDASIITGIDALRLEINTKFQLKS